MKLRVWYITNPPDSPVFIPVETAKQGIEVINAEANRQLKDTGIHSNAFGLEMFEDGEWVEWEHPDLGVFVDEYEQMLINGEIEEAA